MAGNSMDFVKKRKKNCSSVVHTHKKKTFKTSCSMYLYKKYNASSVGGG